MKNKKIRRKWYCFTLGNNLLLLYDANQLRRYNGNIALFFVSLPKVINDLMKGINHLLYIYVIYLYKFGCRNKESISNESMLLLFSFFVMLI
ncbi:Uncharacterised protein [Yersinia intermedia]|uniref:Uncharacterized protein n=1 Tax=Yersinia intermedia TaxID=631 RepID=A0A0T9MDD6_YERIN|nr:Uncharacterised protein [Yersinia intermedia]CRY80666.1 Uncharacterised protein [Yersinia intermedia]VDZ52402.1 Uncharacterised protein [Yersinia intermedia]